MGLDMTEWDRIQTNARDGKYGPFTEIRHAIAARFAADHPEEGLGTSDISHILYGVLKGNEDMSGAQLIYALRYG